MTDTSLMPYGKFINVPMANVPGDYLLWLYNNNKCGGEVKMYIEENLDVIKSELKK